METKLNGWMCGSLINNDQITQSSPYIGEWYARAWCVLPTKMPYVLFDNYLTIISQFPLESTPYGNN